MAETLAGRGAGGDASQVTAGRLPPPGRDTIADRVYTKIAEHTAATIIGVTRREANVDVGQYRDGIVLRVRTPLPVPALDDSASISGGAPVLDRVRQIQDDLRHQVGRLLGRDVVRVDVTVTGAVVAPQRRVR